MTNLPVCRTCLSFSTTMYDFRNTQLQDIYEKLTSKKVNKDSMPAICYICYAQLQRCFKFSEMSWKAEVILTELISKGIKITQETISRLNRRTSNFSVTPKDYFYNGSRDDTLEPSTDSQIEVKVEKVEELFCTDSQIEVKVEKVVEDETLAENAFEEIVLRDAPIYIDEQIIKEEMEEVWFEEDINVESEVTLNDNYDVESEVFVYEHEEYVDIEDLFTNTKENFEELSINDKELPMCFGNSHTNIITKQLPLNCNISSKMCNIGRNMKNHSRTHTKVIYLHVICDKTFQKKINIIKHFKTHANKSYTCMLCDKQFLEGRYLKEYVKIHTKEKPLICDKCGKPFTDKSSFNRHMRSHTGTEVKLSSCRLCNKKFRRKSYVASAKSHSHKNVL